MVSTHKFQQMYKIEYILYIFFLTKLLKYIDYSNVLFENHSVLVANLARYSEGICIIFLVVSIGRGGVLS